MPMSYNFTLNIDDNQDLDAHVDGLLSKMRDIEFEVPETAVKKILSYAGSLQVIKSEISTFETFCS